jgi:hypothetical protein
MGVDQPECGAGRASPAKWLNTNTGNPGKKTSQTFGRRAVGCNLVVLKMACCLLATALQNSSTIFHHAVRATQGALCFI